MLEKGDLVKFTTRGAWVLEDAKKRYEGKSPGVVLSRHMTPNPSKFVYTIWWSDAETTCEYESYLERVNEHNCD
jgi:hypothetical protein